VITKHAELLKKAPPLLYKTAAQLWIDKEFPRHLFIETTAACNLGCEYCPREKIKNHMDYGLFTKIVDEASTHGPRSFSLHLFGEPLLYPKIIEAIKYIKDKNSRHVVLLTTNGTLLHRFIDDLIAVQVDKVIWSWRPEAKFSASLKEKMRRWGRLTVRIIKETVPKEEQRYWGAWPNVERRSLHNYGGNVDTASFGAESMAGKRYPCYHLWYAPAVAWNGNILICCSDPHQKEIIGTFPGMSISSAWKRMDGIRKAHMEGKYEGICKECDVWKNYPDIFFRFQKKHT